MKRLSTWTLLLPLLVLTSRDAWADDKSSGAEEPVPEQTEQAPIEDASTPDVENVVQDIPEPSPTTLDSLVVSAPKHGSGLKLELSWSEVEAEKNLLGIQVLRRSDASDDWAAIGDPLAPDSDSYEDKVPKTGSWDYKLIAVYLDSPEDLEGRIQRATTRGLSSDSVTGKTKAYFLIAKKAHMMLLGLVVLVGFLMMYYTRRAQRGEEIYIRRIPGIDAIEEGIGRSTEMGKPVLYVPGIDDLQDIQTIASMLILGQVSKTVAEYQSDLIVSCCIPIVREVADEVVRAGYYQAGHPDAFNAALYRANDSPVTCSARPRL